MQEFTCVVCHDVFECRRNDKMTCGPTCRQRQHRAKLKGRDVQRRIDEDRSPAERQEIIDRQIEARKARE